ncbi:TPA: sugar transferase [Morganella morganii]|nr:sugar transferase [Morganella morganii]
MRKPILSAARKCLDYPWRFIKLQYDFYYIKHFSFWLDVLVVLKTIRTIVTGNIGSNTAR